MITKKVENLPVYIYDTREEMGAAAAKDAAQRINDIIARRGEANVIFSASSSLHSRKYNSLNFTRSKIALRRKQPKPAGSVSSMPMYSS